MAEDTTVQIQSLLDRLREGDAEARKALAARAYGRLRQIAASIFRHSFPDFQGRHEVDSVLSAVWIRLDQALETARPASPADFFALAAKKSREVLLDLARRERPRWGRESDLSAIGDDSQAPCESPQSTYDPAWLELWSEFHRLVEALEGNERIVFEMHWYGELTQAEIAGELGLTPKQVSRLWLAATERIADRLPGFELS
jgi:RNA polymerase sigma-70 factor (ECF subfamily)